VIYAVAIKNVNNILARKSNKDLLSYCKTVAKLEDNNQPCPLVTELSHE
jgi:hypothetical protein